MVIAKPEAPWLAPLDALPKTATVRIGHTADFFAAEAPLADVILNTESSGRGLRQSWPLASKVRWVHSLSAGVENQVFSELAHSPIPLTNARGVYKESLAEFVIGAVLFFAKDFRRLIRSQAEHRWDQFDNVVIAGQTMGIVGYGEIGRAVARRAKAMGMTVLGCRRRPEPDVVADEVLPNDQIRAMLSRSHYVVVAAPLTPDTRGMVGEAEFSAMRPDGVIVNVGRGPVIDEAALLGALRERRIRGAALDVFDQEPLSPDHPFWDLDNVLLSPHCADHVEGWLESAVAFFVTNYQRFAGGEPLLNVVDKRAGY
jgi:phosphoglycerate dehydrogenase-like enzyme